MVRETIGGLVEKTNPSGHEQLLGTCHARARKSLRCCRKSRQLSESPLEPSRTKRAKHRRKDEPRFRAALPRPHRACGSVLGLP